MSMRTSAEDMYGLLVNPDDVAMYCGITKCFPSDLEEESGDIRYIGDPIGADCLLVTKDGLRDYKAITDGAFLIMGLRKQPELFAAAYSSYEEALAELKETYEKYLPEDFDYESHFKAVYYATWG